MTDKLNVNTIEPEGATTTLTVGNTGKSVIITDNLKANTLKDGGDGYKYAAFTATGANTWTCPTGVTAAEILIVGAGGGGGGQYYSGGGGGGGIVHAVDYAVTAGVVYDITVGLKGQGGTPSSTLGGSGGDSVWNVNAEGSGITMTAKGGGGGNDWDSAGAAGGSGGGGVTGGASNQADFSGATSYGNAGGNNNGGDGGGGGGADAIGGDSATAGVSAGRGGHGGSGRYFANFTSWGTNKNNFAANGNDGGYFSGGGGGTGGGNSDLFGYPGVGGGGKGGQYASGTPTAPTSALPNTGGGGGGSSHNVGTVGGQGGHGIVIIRYQDPTPNTLFTSNGSGVVTSINAGFGSAQNLLSTATLSSNATINFTSGIDDTYKEYIFQYINIHGATDATEWQFQVSSDGGSNYNLNTTNTYFRAYHVPSSTTSLGYTTGRDIANGTGFICLGFDCGNASDEAASGILHLYNPASTTFVKNYYARTIVQQDSNAAFDGFVAGYFNTTAVINAVRFKFSAGNADSGIIKMYGIK